MQEQKSIESKNSVVLDQDMIRELVHANSNIIQAHLPELFIASTICALCIFSVWYIIPEKTWRGIKFKKLFICLLSGIIFALCLEGFVYYIEKVDPPEENIKIVLKSRGVPSGYSHSS